MSQEPTINSSNVLSLFQPKIAVIDYIRKTNKQGLNAQVIYKYISRTQASNVNKTDIVNSINDLVKQNLIINKKKQFRL